MLASIFLKIYFFVILSARSYYECDCTALRPRLSTAEYTNYNHFEPEGPGTYAFGYEIDDPETENVQFRDEERFPNGTVAGRYGYVMPDGNVHVVRYIADGAGYRAFIEEASSAFRTNDLNYDKNHLATEITPAVELGGDEVDEMLRIIPNRFYIRQN